MERKNLLLIMLILHIISFICMITSAIYKQPNLVLLFIIPFVGIAYWFDCDIKKHRRTYKFWKW